jgi:hypothetical protein
MGWAPWSTIRESHQPHTLVYADLTWREFEPQEGYYDFDGFELSRQLDRWRTEGKRVVFRFVVDKPGKEAHLDIPDWLYKKINGEGDHYNNGYGQGFSPDYTHPEFIQSHKKAIEALGKRYGRDDFIAYIEIGSLGHWGEWHVDTQAGIQPLPIREIRDTYVNHYLENFPETHLMMRRPYSIVKDENLGIFNDLTGDPEGTAEWLDWIMNGNRRSDKEYDNDIVAVPDAWLLAPIGGEQTSHLTNRELYGSYLERTIKLLKQSHTTFIGPNCPSTYENGGRVQEGIDNVLSIIGYRFWVDEVEMNKWAMLNSRIEVEASICNAGIAPMYYSWPVRFYLIDEIGDIAYFEDSSQDLRKIIPGSCHKATIDFPTNELNSGVYTVGLAVIDPLTNEPAVSFAMENDREDLIFELGYVSVKRFIRNLLIH